MTTEEKLEKAMNLVSRAGDFFSIAEYGDDYIQDEVNAPVRR